MNTPDDTNTTVTSQLDVTMTLPHEVNVLKFIESRASEMAMATDELMKKRPKLAMQQLPRHLRRRATSHNVKRLPRRLRERAAKEFEKMKVKKTKRPSRRHRRRPSNLLADYNRRKRKHNWLETHIWFAKRFKMVEKWGYKIGLKPNDKGVRAAYRASARHCLMQDISYYCCIELVGTQESILRSLTRLVSPTTGLTFGAKIFLNGTREGNVMVYCADSFPYDALCPVRFLWRTCNDETRKLWLWCHPAAHEQLTSELAKVFQIEMNTVDKNSAKQHVESDEKPTIQSELEVPKAKSTETVSAQKQVPQSPSTIEIISSKKSTEHETVKTVSTNAKGTVEMPKDPSCSVPKELSLNTATAEVISSKKTLGKSSEHQIVQTDSTSAEKRFERTKVYVGNEVTMILLKDNLVRYRLTGPLAQSCLTAALHAAHVDPDPETESPTKRWWTDYYKSEESRKIHTMQAEFWDAMRGEFSSQHLPPGLVVALTVRDPRMTLPKIRTKALPDVTEDLDRTNFAAQQFISNSAIWEPEIRDEICDTKMPESEINRLRYQLSTESTTLDLGVAESRIPILLLHNPGIGNSGYGSSWDVVIPSGWGMAFWIAFTYRGARAAGLQEHRSVAHEAGIPVFPSNYPDSEAGRKESDETYAELAAKHRRYPPDKRPSFQKLGIKAPFFCPYRELVQEWQKIHVTDELDVAVAEKSKFFVVRNKSHLKILQKACDECHFDKKTASKRRKTMQPTRVLTNGLDRFKALLISPDGIELRRSLVFVELECTSRGCPKEFSAVCLPQVTDLQGLKFRFGGPSEKVHPIKKTTQKCGKKRKLEQIDLTKPSVVSNIVDGCARRVLGFVEAGEFSFRKARGTGLGFCSILGLVQLLDICKSCNSKPVVLLRAQHSFQYRFANLRVAECAHI